MKARLKPKKDTPNAVRLKMLAVCAGEGCQPRLEDILERLLDELAQGSDEAIQLIRTCELDDFLWERAKRDFGYADPNPSLRDFAVELFHSCYAMGLEEKAPLAPEALVFLRRWKDSRQHHQAFETLSNQCAQILNIEGDLPKRALKDLLEMDYFRLIDQRP